jgi:hypothetical protein
VIATPRGVHASARGSLKRGLCSGSTCFEQVHSTSPHGKAGDLLLPAVIGVLLVDGAIGLPLALHPGSRTPAPRREPEWAADEANAGIERLLTQAEATAASLLRQAGRDADRGRFKVTVIRETRAVGCAR